MFVFPDVYFAHTAVTELLSPRHRRVITTEVYDK